MALVFSTIMTALLARDEISTYFGKIVRHRVEDVLKETKFPFLSAAASDNEERHGAGDGRVTKQANYTLLAANRIAGTKGQDEVIEEMVTAIEAAAVALVYQEGGWAAEIRLGDWAADEAAGQGPGRKVWVEMDLSVLYRPI